MSYIIRHGSPESPGVKPIFLHRLMSLIQRIAFDAIVLNGFQVARDKWCRISQLTFEYWKLSLKELLVSG